MRSDNDKLSQQLFEEKLALRECGEEKICLEDPLERTRFSAKQCMTKLKESISTKEGLRSDPRDAKLNIES